MEINNYDLTKITYQKNEPKIIVAHESNIAYITMNIQGTIMATASDKGTLIRLFNIAKGDMITELRRGSKNAKINCLSIDINTEFLACSSESHTVHIFDIHEVNKIIEKNDEKDKTNEDNQKEKAAFGKSYGFIKINERSFAKIKIIEEKAILGFCPKNSIIILTLDGKFQKASYDIKGGSCKVIEENYIKSDFN